MFIVTKLVEGKKHHTSRVTVDEENSKCCRNED